MSAIGAREREQDFEDRSLADRKFKIRWSAGSLSLVFHFVAFVLMAIFIRPASQLSPKGVEAERTVGIVLTRTDQSTADRYLEASEVADANRNAQVATGGTGGVPAALDDVSEFVPQELALPSAEFGSVASEVGSARVNGASRKNGSIPIAGDVAGLIAEEQRRLAAARPRGSPVGLSLFGGGQSAGRSFIFLIDRSKSMGAEGLGALEAAEKELLRALAPLQPEHQFQVVAYHHQCVYLNQRQLLSATKENKDSVSGFLSGLAAFGATEHEMALQSALAHHPDVIYLLTDGGDPELTVAQLQKISRLAAGKTQIHCVQFGFGSLPTSGGFLRQLAEMNGGSFAYVDMSRP